MNSPQAFSKYHGAGNDFILIDDRNNCIHETFDRGGIAALCHRHFGIGADGLMFLRSHAKHDFEMVYYNSDGAPSSMCGNGGRCIVRFAADLGVIDANCEFLAVDGLHEAHLTDDDWVSLKMTDVHKWAKPDDNTFILDTGSPHYIKLDACVADVDVVAIGRSIRYSPAFAEKGINVNFLERPSPGRLKIATYERGVEDETLACGTGVTAAAIAAAQLDGVLIGERFTYEVEAKGGNLRAKGLRTEKGFEELWLEGPTVKVFNGVV